MPRCPKATRLRGLVRSVDHGQSCDRGGSRGCRSASSTHFLEASRCHSTPSDATVNISPVLSRRANADRVDRAVVPSVDLLAGPVLPIRRGSVRRVVQAGARRQPDTSVVRRDRLDGRGCRGRSRRSTQQGARHRKRPHEPDRRPVRVRPSGDDARHPEASYSRTKRSGNGPPAVSTCPSSPSARRRPSVRSNAPTMAETSTLLME